MTRHLRRITRSLIPWVTLAIILFASVALIAYGRGYRLDLQKNTLRPTGLISATSDPVGSQVYVDGSLRSATNITMNIDPGYYTVDIKKEGYIPWQKHVRVQGEVVTRADAFLFPANPSLSPLTSTGIENPVVSPDGTKVAYAIPFSEAIASKKAGLWVYELADRTLGRNRDPQQVGTSDNLLDFSKAAITWSPDSTQLLADNGVIARLIPISRPQNFQDLSLTKQNTLTEWEQDRQVKERSKLVAFPKQIIDIATSSAKIISFSPDESKILYEATAAATIPERIIPALIGTNYTEEKRTLEPGKIYVYDLKEDRNYLVLDKKELPAFKPTPTPATKRPVPTPPKLQFTPSGQTTNIHWFPTSRHLVLTLEGKIDIMEFDRTNWITVYSGPFVDNFIAPWPNGSRIIIMTNLNPNAQPLPNLYTVNLR